MVAALVCSLLFLSACGTSPLWGGFRHPRAFAGRKITILTTCFNSDAPAALYRTHLDFVRSIARPRAFATYGSTPRFRTSVFLYADEGITWCYGWEGPAVDALRVVTALQAQAA